MQQIQDQLRAAGIDVDLETPSNEELVDRFYDEAKAEQEKHNQRRIKKQADAFSASVYMQKKERKKRERALKKAEW